MFPGFFIKFAMGILLLSLILHLFGVRKCGLTLLLREGKAGVETKFLMILLWALFGT